MRMPAQSSRRTLLNAAGGVAAAMLVPVATARAASAALPPGALTAVTLIHGIAGAADDLKAHLLSLAAPTRAEPGCIAYDLYQSPQQPHEFMRFEIWASPEALEAHKQTPHLKASFEKRQKEGWTTQILTWIRVAE